MKDEIIEKISRIVTTKNSSESEVDHLMTLIRKLKEREGGNLHAYPILGLFCDWTKHTALDRNAEGHKIIVELNDKLRLLLKNEASKNMIFDETTKIISFERLQHELRVFLSDYQLPLDLVTKKELWLRFVINLINIVSECPLRLPERRRSMISSSIDKGVVATSLNLSWQSRTNKKKALCLIIELSNQKKVGVPCRVLGKYIEATEK